MNTEIAAKLLNVIEYGGVDELREVLADYPEYLQYKYGATSWLSGAVYTGSIDKCRLLIDLGADVNQVDQLTQKLSKVPLDTAIAKDNLAMTRFLLERGANPNQGRQIISAITGNKHSLELVQLLEAYGADIHREFLNEHTGQQMNALSTALDWGKEDVAEYLKSRGCVLPGQSPHKGK
ncbi:ankyrin repeat domain-containing protein [Aeoliella sp. SH292]|uniref:ankyrin repeat domain-containing protein n=1 Tax=Aeoliella sp. SH292 TaxID=3454464 RepID=UPI003F9ADEC6